MCILNDVDNEIWDLRRHKSRNPVLDIYKLTNLLESNLQMKINFLALVIVPVVLFPTWSIAQDDNLGGLTGDQLTNQIIDQVEAGGGPANTGTANQTTGLDSNTGGDAQVGSPIDEHYPIFSNRPGQITSQRNN